MTYGEWIGVETRRECERETIAKKLKRGCTPTWIHEEDKFPMELIREVQACMESGKGEMYESIMKGLMENLQDVRGDSQERKTVIGQVSEENSSLYNSMIRLEAYRQDYIDAVRREYARERIKKKLKKGRTPEWIHEEDEYPLELILEVQASMGNEMYKSIMKESPSAAGKRREMTTKK